MAARPMTEILKLAAALAEELAADIALAKTREEHIRVTARANAAAQLLNVLTAAAASN